MAPALLRDLPATKPDGPAGPVPEPLDIAYIALGAKQALDDWRAGPANPFSFEGELAYIEACIDQAPALQRAWERIQDGFDLVWCYDVAEPFGAAYGKHLLAGGTPEVADRILQALLQEALTPTPA